MASKVEASPVSFVLKKNCLLCLLEENKYSQRSFVFLSFVGCLGSLISVCIPVNFLYSYFDFRIWKSVTEMQEVTKCEQFISFIDVLIQNVAFIVFMSGHCS